MITAFIISLLVFGSRGAITQDAIHDEEFLRLHQEIGQNLGQRNFGEAVKLAERLCRKYPENTAAWLALAQVHMHDSWPMRKDARAEEAMEQALALSGSDPNVLFLYAVVKFRQRKYEESLATIHKLVDGPLMRLNKYQEASLLVMRAQLTLRNHVMDPEAGERALQDLNRALQLDPQNSDARVERANLLIDREQWDDALEDLQYALALAPGSRQVHWRLKSLYMHRGRVRQGQTSYGDWR